MREDRPATAAGHERSGSAPRECLPRVVDTEMRASLRASPAVLIEGPRACGKTWTGRRFAADEVLMDASVQARLAANVDPATLLDAPPPLLLDEWQLAPDIWNPMRRACDDRGRPGQFILTGSADPPDDITRHSGAGRVLRVRMRPMSLFESGESSGSVSLAGLFDPGRRTARNSGHHLGEIMALACRGGWPALVSSRADPPSALRALRGYLDEISRTDVSRVDGVARNPAGVRRLLQSLARNIASEASFATLAADTSGDDPGIDRKTVSSYIAALARLFVVEDLPAWRPHITSRSALRNAPKRHYTDPSLAAAALGLMPEAVMADLKFAGLLFESLVVRDLRVYGQPARCEISHYRDSDGLEVDAIVKRADGRWIAVEVKLGGESAIHQAVRTLGRLRKRVDASRTGEPARLVVITSGGYGYEHPDGVTVVPITALGP
ncbi:ATP-binding protein [Candidatus Spongiisocius sp.]|uniref:ATP-binding protein n=1 Tax=Candidatus Spongiisocius sp. TaxID=3101273 RepID=UPI003B5A90DA